MSIESNLQSIADSLSALVEIMSSAPSVPDYAPAPVVAAAVVPAPVPVAAPAPTPVVVPVNIPGPVVVEAAGPVVPFADAKGLIEYTMGKYNTLGPVRGGAIQQVITALGHANLNAIRPEQYAQFFTQVEAL